MDYALDYSKLLENGFNYKCRIIFKIKITFVLCVFRPSSPN